MRSLREAILFRQGNGGILHGRPRSCVRISGLGAAVYPIGIRSLFAANQSLKVCSAGLSARASARPRTPQK